MNEIEEVISNWNDWKYTSFAKTYTKSAIASVKRINRKDKERYYALLYLKEWTEQQLQFYQKNNQYKQKIITNNIDFTNIIKPKGFDNWTRQDKKIFKIQIIQHLVMNGNDDKTIAQILINTGINPKANENNIRVYKIHNKILEKIIWLAVA